MKISKPSSLKQYLFAITGLFIVLLTAVQLMVFGYVESQIQQEIEQRSRTLSDVAVNVLNKQVFNQRVQNKRGTPDSTANHAEGGIRLLVESKPGFEVPLGDGYIFKSGPETTVIRVLPDQPSSSSPVTVAHTPHMALSRVGDSYRVAVAGNSEQWISQHVVQFEQGNSVVEKYFNWIVMTSLVLMGCLLLYFFWLTGKITHPLKLLGDGFKHLEKGRFGNKIPEIGVDEVKYTLQQFNHMSQRLHELKLREQAWQQQQQLLEIHEVSKGLAHTLRNPLNTIGLAVEQIVQPGVSDDARVALAKNIRQKIIHLDKTIKTMLRLNSHDLNRDVPINLDEVIVDLIMELGRSDGPAIHYKKTTPEVHFKGAESEVRAMLHCLISNAVEASDQGQIVDVTVAEQSDKVVVTVADQGVGIANKDINELFKPHTSDKPEGAGMGLFLAQRICTTYYRGSISLQQNKPKGCIATLSMEKEITSL